MGLANSLIIGLSVLAAAVSGSSVPASGLAGSDTLTIPSNPFPGFAVENDSLVNPGALSRFYAALDSLEAGCDTVINVIHLGDSHIQAGYMSLRVKDLLQDRFSNAGRGLVTPLRLAGTNGPEDYSIRSSLRCWDKGRLTRKTGEVPAGIGGFAIRAGQGDFTVTFASSSLIFPKNEFSEVLLYRGARSTPLIPDFSDPQIVEVSPAKAPDPVAGIMADTFRFVCPADTLRLRPAAVDSSGSCPVENDYYGLNLANGSPGLLFHIIGLNGASFSHYLNPDYIRQLTLLHPSLIIVSLGTNDSCARNFSAAAFRSDLSALVALLHSYLPDTDILLTAPAGSFVRRRARNSRGRRYTYYKANSNTAKVAEEMLDAAGEGNFAVWNLFNATGGAKSGENFFNAGLMRKDRVHYTVPGYEGQGTLLFRALMNSYSGRDGLGEVRDD